jgi:uncharacterized protein YndB with AHSA1/START domain
MLTTVKAEKFVKASPAQVYYAFTHAIALHEWLCDFATVAPRPGGRMYLWWHGDFYSAGEYTALEENKSVAFTWFGRGDPGPSQVKVTLEPKDGGTNVVMAHTIPDWTGWKSSPEEFLREWADSLENLAQVLETGLDKRTFDRPMLGINIRDFSPEIAKALGVPVTQGVRLDNLLEEMGAYKAGLRKDDVLVQLAGKPITNDYGSLVASLQGRKGGDKVEVVFYRGPEKKTVTMELTRRPMPEIPWEPVELAKAVRLKYDEALATLEQCFAGVSETEADLRPAPAEWSAKDTLAHLIQTERNSVANLDDVVGGYERLSDDWGGNIDAHIQATAAAYKTVQGMLDELKRLTAEVVAFLAALPPEFIARKSSYFLWAWQLLQGQSHTLSHVEQIKVAISAARKK